MLAASELADLAKTIYIQRYIAAVRKNIMARTILFNLYNNKNYKFFTKNYRQI